MPTPVWSCQVSFDGVVLSNNSPGNPSTFYQNYSFGLIAIAQPSLDPLPNGNPAVDYGHMAVQLGYQSSSGQAYMAILFQSAPGNPGDFFARQWFPSLYTEAIFAPFSALAGGGTITLTKDFDAGTLVATSPVGTISTTLAALDANMGTSYNNNEPLRCHGIFSSSGSPLATFSYPAYAIDDEVRFHDLITKKDGVTFDSTALSAADPGTWYPLTYVYGYVEEDTAVENFGGSAWWTTIQDTSEFQIEAIVTIANYPAFDALYLYQRLLMTPVTSAPSMIRAPEHGSLYAALVYAVDPTALRFRATYDQGRSWTETTLFSDGHMPNSNPSLAWAGDRLLCFWQQSGSTLVQAFSRDLGATWSTPAAMSITGTNPTLLVDPFHGTQFYFYVDGSNNLQLVRSADYGQTFIDASPHLVAAAITPQTIAAEFTSDGNLIVGFIAAGAWTQLRSLDYGLTWS